MEFINYTPFPALAYVTMDANDDEFHMAVMRATMDIRPDGTLAVADVQLPLVTSDQFYDEMNQSSVRQESDLAGYKPMCDVIAIATAYAPGGKPAQRFPAGIRIREAFQPRPVPPRPYGMNPTMAATPEKLAAWEKEVAAVQADPLNPGPVIREKILAVNGPRYWQKGILGGWSLTPSEPVKAWRIRYEYAYGGENKIEPANPEARKVPEKHRLTPEQRAQHPEGPDKAPVAHTVCETNAVGCGYAEPWYLKAMNYGEIRAPLIESPADPVKEFGKAYAVQGLGVISRTWQPRLDLAGTYDEAWLNERHPSLPDDFDFAYWNCAHPDLQMPYPEGNEVIELINLCPHDTPAARQDSRGNTILRFALPSRRIRLTLESEEGKFDTTDMMIDTLIVEPDERRVSIVWRKALPFSAGIAVAEAQVRALRKEDGKSS